MKIAISLYKITKKSIKKGGTFMNKYSKKIVSALTIALATFLLFSISVSANTSTEDKNQIDALNPELEEQKIQELTGEDSKEGFTLEVGEPLTVEFDDGSSITYEVDVKHDELSLKDQIQKNNYIAAGSIDYKATKTYTYAAIGSAKINLHVNDVSRTVNSRGASFTFSSDSSDLYQSVASTTFATVDTGSTYKKYTWFDSYSRGFKSQARGKITYNILGVTHQSSYTFSIQVDPLNPYDIIWISNNKY